MRLFYDGYIFTCQKHGGINRVFLELAAKMPAIDDSIIMYLFRFPKLSAENGILKRYFMVPKLGGILRKMDVMLLPEIANSFVPEIYHPTYYRYPHNLKHGKKVITVHDMIHEIYPQYFKYNENNLKEKRHCIESADKIIAVSENTKSDVMRYYKIPENKISVVYNAASQIFNEINEGEKAKRRRKYNIKRPFILYVGQRRGYKNFLILLKVFSLWEKNKEIDLLCIGGEARWDKEEAAIIRNANLSNSVKLFHNISDEELKLLYSLAEVFIYPSLYEGFGIPILEAMACGTPVIVSNTASMPEVAGEAGLYFSPDSIDELLSALNKMIDDLTLRRDLKAKGLNRSRSFSWEKTAKETYQVYKELLG